MTNRLVIRFPNSSITIDSDSSDKLISLSDFCKKDFGAYYATENTNELTVDNLSEEQCNKFHSLLFELNLV